MKKFKIIVIALLVLTFVSGCKDKIEEVSTRPSNYESYIVDDKDANLTLEKLYKDLKSEFGGEYALKHLLEAIIEEELKISTDEEIQQLYATRVNEVLLKYTKDSKYKRYKTFDEELLVESLMKKGINVECNYGYGPRYNQENLEVEEYLLCDYSELVEKELKFDLLVDLLLEKYVLEVLLEDTPDAVSKKRVRRVEYFTIDKEGDGNEAYTFMSDAVADLMDGKTFKELKSEWDQTKIKKIEEEYEKIGTSTDFSGSIRHSFSYMGSTFIGAEAGRLEKIREVYETKRVHEMLISTSDKGNFADELENIYNILIDKNVIENKTIEINDENFLVSPLVQGDADERDIIILENNKYYFIKVSLLDEENPAELREMVASLKESLTSADKVMEYYFGKYNIGVYDEDVYAVFKKLYPSFFS